MFFSVGTASADAALAQARAKFQQGLALETAGDWAGALALFREVAGVKLTPQVRFNIAVCEEHLGKLALALGDYRLATAEADDSNAKQVAAQASERIEALQARVSRIIVKRGPGADFATISLDGVVLGDSSVGTEMVVDPGPHSVEARAPGFNMFMTSFNMAEKETKTIEVTLARPTVASSKEPAPIAPTAGADAATSSGPAAKAGVPSGGHSWLPFAVGGLGAASLVTSGVFFLERSSVMSDLDAQCGPTRDRCPPASAALFDKGHTYTTIADVTLAVGVVGLAAGAVLYLTEKPASTASAIGFVPAASGATAGGSLVGRF